MKCIQSKMDRLEQRAMLATDFAIELGVLETNGDSSRNVISIHIDDDSAMLALDGQWERFVDADDFHSIRINGKGGSDRILVTTEDTSMRLVIVGGSGDDWIKVDSSDSRSRVTISGGAGDDTLRSNTGRNELFGGDDDDSLYVTRGRASLAGGDGDDKLSFQGASSIDAVRFMRGNGGRDTLIGSHFDDDMLGDGGRDRMYGNDGNDSIEGGSGIDFILGGFGNDTIFGGQHIDNIFGGPDFDVIYRFERIAFEVRDFLNGVDLQI